MSEANNQLDPGWLELHPQGEAYITEFTHAVALHDAASSLKLLQNRQDVRFYPGKTAEVLKQRASMLDLSCRLVVRERDKALDDFCMKWVKMRGLAVGP